MKLNSFFCSVAALSMLGTLASCQSSEDVKMPEQSGIDLSNSETVSFAIQMPVNDLKTRAGEEPVLSYGSDGLYSFSRTIDKLWYGVYYQGTLLYNSTEAGIPQGEYDSESGTFTLDLQIPEINGTINLSDYKVFFFAGNASDKVALKEITDGIGLDFENKTLYAYPTLLNTSVASGDIYNPAQYDYFAKYVTLSDVVDENLNGDVVLIRPFCQITLLTDELCQAAVLKTLDSNSKVTTTTTPSVYTQIGAATSKSLAYGWNYDADRLITKDITSLTFTLNACALNNWDGSLNIPQEVTFNSRKMYCVASYLMLAPNTRKAYIASATAQQFVFDLSLTGDRYSTSTSVSVNLPNNGLMANEKYVIYNRQSDAAGSGSGGDGGLLTNHYLMDVQIDPIWTGNSTIQFN